MIAVPSVVEGQVHERLRNLGYEPTNNVTATGRFWLNRDHRRHLLVPNSDNGTYPQWLIDELIHNADRVGDEAVALAVRGVKGWERLIAERDRPRPRTRPRLVAAKPPDPKKS